MVKQVYTIQRVKMENIINEIINSLQESDDSANLGRSLLDPVSVEVDVQLNPIFRVLA